MDGGWRWRGRQPSRFNLWGANVGQQAWIGEELDPAVASVEATYAGPFIEKNPPFHQVSGQFIEKIESAHPHGNVDARSQHTNTNGLIVSRTPHLFDKRQTELFKGLQVLYGFAHHFRVG